MSSILRLLVLSITIWQVMSSTSHISTMTASKLKFPDECQQISLLISETQTTKMSCVQNCKWVLTNCSGVCYEISTSTCRSYSTRWFFRVSEPNSFYHQNKATCEAHGGYLPMVWNAEQDGELHNFLMSEYYLRATYTNGKYIDSKTGVEITYFNRAFGRADEVNRYTIVIRGNGEWKSLWPSTYTMPIVCEFANACADISSNNLCYVIT